MKEWLNKAFRTYQDAPFWLAMALLAVALILQALAALLR